MSYTDDLVKKVLNVKLGPPKIENFPKLGSMDDYYKIAEDLEQITDKISGIQTVPAKDQARDCLIEISNKIATLESENESLKRALESKIKIENADDVRKELRRTFDVAFTEAFGVEAFPLIRKHLKERLGI